MAHPAVSNPEPRILQFDWEDIQRGVPLSAIDAFASFSGLAVKDFIEVVIPARTLKHRRQRNETLSLDESDRLARVARLYSLAVRVFGNPEKARKWLSSTKHRFDENTPIAMMRTESGGRKVEDMLIQIDEGYFA